MPFVAVPSNLLDSWKQHHDLHASNFNVLIQSKDSIYTFAQIPLASPTPRIPAWALPPG